MKIGRIKSHLIKGSVVLFGVVSMWSFQTIQVTQETNSVALVAADVQLKKAALEVLQTKCNVCHETKNPRKFFTSKNMSDLAPKIYKQVFIKRRMPKSKTIRLTNAEYTTLEQWLFTEKIF